MPKIKAPLESLTALQSAPCSDHVEGASQDNLPIYSADGVDLTLIRWMLSLSPIERLRTAQRYANSAQKLRNAPRRIRF